MKRIIRTETIVSGEGKGTKINVVPMGIDELKQLRYGQQVLCHSYNGIIHVKVNGNPKTWKTRPNDVDIPVKYGLYEYARIEYRDGAMSDNSLWIAKEIK